MVCLERVRQRVEAEQQRRLDQEQRRLTVAASIKPQQGGRGGEEERLERAAGGNSSGDVVFYDADLKKEEDWESIADRVKKCHATMLCHNILCVLLQLDLIPMIVSRYIDHGLPRNYVLL